jgi:hypothetical protein
MGAFYLSCNCEVIRIEARGEPVRVGLCHCTTCRKKGGASFTESPTLPAGSVTVEDKMASRKDAADARHFCPSSVHVVGVAEGTGRIEIRLGTLHQAPTDLAPSYETYSRPVGLTKPWSRHRDSGVVTVNLLGDEDVLADRYARQGITSMLDAVCLGGPGGLAARSDRGDLRA